MHESGGAGEPAEIDARLLKLEAELAAQRAEMAALRAELDQMRPPPVRTARPELVRDLLRTVAEPASTAAAMPAKKAVDAPLQTPQVPVAWSRVVPDPVTAGAERDSTRDSPGPAFAGADARRPVEPTVQAAVSVIFASNTAGAKAEPQRSVENRIGSQVFNRVGIVAILIGVSLFLKLVYDKHWIHFNPTSRIAMLLLAGAGVVLWSERFRRKGYAAFSYSLKAVGTGTLYLALWASFQMYHLMPAWAALLLMIGVTVWNAVMAWAQDSELLAAYALVGGFATPGLLGSGGNHEVFLFCYVLAMDIAVLLLVMKKPWQRLLLGSFPGTIIYFIGWYVKFFTAGQAGVTGLFAVLLAMPFAAVALVGKQREDEWEGLLAPLAAATFAGLTLYSVLQDSGRHGWLPWGAVALAAIYLLLMRLRRGGVAEAVHLAIAVVFLTVAIPLKAEGRWITVGWLAEGVALLWVAARLLGPQVQARVRALMRWLGCGAMALGVGESLVFWSQQTARSAFWNGRFATEMCAVAALALAGWLARVAAATDDAEQHIQAPAWSTLRLLSAVGTHLVAALTVSRDLAAFWANGPAGQAGYNNQLSALSVAAFLLVYAACLVAWIAMREAKDADADVVRAVSMMAALYAALGFLVTMLAPTVGDGSAPHLLWNARLIFQLCGVAALALMAWFARMALRDKETISTAIWPRVALSATLAAHVTAIVAGCREIFAYWTSDAASSLSQNPLAGTVLYKDQLHALSIGVFLMVYGSALVVWVATRSGLQAFDGQRAGQRTVGSLLLLGGTLDVILTPVLGGGGPGRVFWNARLMLEVLGVAALGLAAWRAWRARSIQQKEERVWMQTAAWCLVGFNLLAVLAGVREILTYFGVGATGEAGLVQAFTISTLLMLYGAALLAAGFWKRMAFVRWQGLVLLVFTIGKVFVYDVRNLSSVYRMLSFIGLGVVLMAVSFAYQKDWLKLRDEAPGEAAS